MGRWYYFVLECGQLCQRPFWALASPGLNTNIPPPSLTKPYMVFQVKDKSRWVWQTLILNVFFSPSGSFSENTAFNMQTTIIWLYHSAAKIGFGINWGFYIASIYIIVTFLFCLWFLYMDVITCRKSGVWSVFGQRPVHCHNQLSVWLPLMRDQIRILWYVWALKLLSNVRNPSVIWTDRSLYLTLQCILRDSAEGGGFKMMKAYV